MINSIQIMGYLGQDPETKQVNDTTVTNFSVATTESKARRLGTDVLCGASKVKSLLSILARAIRFT